MAFRGATAALAAIVVVIVVTGASVEAVVVSGSAAVVQNSARTCTHVAPAATTGAVSAARVAQLCAAAIGLDVSPHVQFAVDGVSGPGVRAVAPDAGVGPAAVVCAVLPGATLGQGSLPASTASSSLSVSWLGLAGPVVEPAYSEGVSASVSKLATVRGGRYIRPAGAEADVSCRTGHDVAALLRDAGVDAMAEKPEEGDCDVVVVRHDGDALFELGNPVRRREPSYVVAWRSLTMPSRHRRVVRL